MERLHSKKPISTNPHVLSGGDLENVQIINASCSKRSPLNLQLEYSCAVSPSSTFIEESGLSSDAIELSFI